MDKDDLIKALEYAEGTAAELADNHKHGCPIEGMARDMSAACREARESLVGKGPAQVATDNYRRNWEGIFGGKQTWGQA